VPRAGFSGFQRWIVAAVVTAGVLGGALLARLPAAVQDPSRVFKVSARRYAFSPAVIEVLQDDLVKVELRSEDIAHSFTIDEYRIAKRAGAGETVSFEFRAAKTGSFPYYCNLLREEGCRHMRGTLQVRPR
jgi:heme/copper-type cytochrome/quinol oxidase subunit 2